MSLVGPIKIIGCGLIGTSLALRLKEEGLALILADTSARNLQLASDLLECKEVAEKPSLIIIAIPPEYVHDVAMAEFALHPEAIFIDVCGVKSKLMLKVESFPELSRKYVSVHPMAGREISGPESARSDLFKSRAWLVTKSENSTDEAVATAR